MALPAASIRPCDQGAAAGALGSALCFDPAGDDSALLADPGVATETAGAGILWVSAAAAATTVGWPPSGSASPPSSPPGGGA